MDDVWFAPGLTSREFESFLQALALHDMPHPPLLAVARGSDDDAKLVMASRALFRLFGVADEAGLSARLLGGRDPGARRLATLAQTMPLEGAPRLERLRFFIGPGSEIITFLCRRLTSASGVPVFVAAALGVRAGLIPAAPEPAAPIAAQPVMAQAPPIEVRPPARLGPHRPADRRAGGPGQPARALADEPHRPVSMAHRCRVGLHDGDADPRRRGRRG